MKGTFIDFLQLVVDNPELAEQLEQLAARFDFEFTDEVSDEELENVAGGLSVVKEQLSSEPAPKELSQQSDIVPNESDDALNAGQLAAPYIPGGSVLSAAMSGLGQLKNSLGA
jgi:hypothetical protein